MKNKTFLAITIFAISLFIIPQMTFASWWKPNTWKIFNKKSEVKTEQKIIATSTPNNVISQTEKATTTPTLSRSSSQSVGAEKIEQKSEEVKKNDQSKEIEKLKKEVEVLKQKQPQKIKVVEKITEKQVIAEKKESSSSQTKQNENVITLPNGAVIEMDASGNVVRTIKDIENVISPSTFKHIIVSAPQFMSKEIKKGEKDVQLISLLLQSAGDTPVRIEEANLRIIGPANTIKTIKISNCGIPQSLNNNGEAVLSCPLLIKNGSSNRYNIVANIADDISSENGKTIQVSVESIKANDAVISGEFPIVSAPHKIVSPPAPAKVTVSPGQVDTRYIFSAIKISSDKKVFLNSIKWYQSGSGGAENIKTYIGNTSYEAVSSEGKYFTSNLGGIVINPNETKEIYVKGDNIGHQWQWLSFDIYKASDINITDENGNVITPQAEQLWDYENSGGFRNGIPWYDGYRIEIKN